MSRVRLLRALAMFAGVVGVGCSPVPTEHLVGGPSFARPGTESPPLRLTITATLPDAAVNTLLSDGLSSVPGAPTGSYDNGVCGVSVARDGETTALYFRPTGFPYKPKPGSGCPPDPRVAYVALSANTPVHLTDDPHEDTSLGAQGLVASDESFLLGSLKVRSMTHTTEVTPRPGTVNFAFCLDDGVGRGMRYNAVDYPGSDNLVVTPLGGGRWHAQSQPWPANKAWCLHTNPDGSAVTLIMHLDIAVDVEEIP